MEFFSGILVFFAGLWAGTINSVVGSGTLVTFPVLIALGIAPVTASMSNAMGLVAGGAAGAWGYRRELKGRGRQLLRLLPASLLGGISGAWLLLHLPEKVFHYAAPALIVLALLMVVFQPRLQRWVRNREENPEHALRDKHHGILLVVLVYLAGVYGGYFVAAQGILLVGILGVFMTGTIQNANAMKNILVLGVNLIAAASYLLFAFDRINWTVVGIIAVSSLIGGLVGSKVGRRLSPPVLRGVIFALGLVALGFMVANLLKG
ncbi:sulfite exporter TauE/SafE family protein [Arthrobacter sp. NPDC057388]|uniref:sulfite exporter TauE/SafE family protein n=1 Tax=Arthrobacter sp. NPDC057388 TaxID=3346116 RepID=UPI00362CA749